MKNVGTTMLEEITSFFQRAHRGTKGTDRVEESNNSTTVQNEKAASQTVETFAALASYRPRANCP